MTTASRSPTGAPVDPAVPAPQPPIDDKRTPGDQARVLTPEEDLDHAIEESFPASDPISSGQVDGPRD